MPGRWCYQSLLTKQISPFLLSYVEQVPSLSRRYYTVPHPNPICCWRGSYCPLRWDLSTWLLPILTRINGPLGVLWPLDSKNGFWHYLSRALSCNQWRTCWVVLPNPPYKPKSPFSDPMWDKCHLHLGAVTLCWCWHISIAWLSFYEASYLFGLANFDEVTVIIFVVYRRNDKTIFSPAADCWAFPSRCKQNVGLGL